MYDKVFISYAKEDYLFAQSLFDFLKEKGFQPWLDKAMILPGQNWDTVIKKALREANYTILLLSDISVKKRGYIQKEFKLALEYFEEKLEDDIYIIPLKINDCEIPVKLQKFHWTEYESHDCFNQIFQSLSLQRDKYFGYKNRNSELTLRLNESTSLRSTYRVRILNSDGDLHYERYFYLELNKDIELKETRKDMMGNEVPITDFPPTAKVISSIPRGLSLAASDVVKYESIRGGRKHYDYAWRYQLNPPLKRKRDFIEYGYSAIIPKGEPKAFSSEGALFFFYHHAIPLDIKYSLIAPPGYCINILDYWIEDYDGRKEILAKSEAPILDDSGQLLSWLPTYKNGYCFICRYNLIAASVNWAKPPIERE